MHSPPSVLSVACSLSTSVATVIKRKEVPILKKGKEGKLLVSSVKRKVSTSYVNVSKSASSSNSRMARKTSECSDGSMGSVNEEDELGFRSRAVESELRYQCCFYLCLIPL